MNNNMRVYIDYIPETYINYFLWFILGFYELEAQGNIKFYIPFKYRLYAHKNRFIRVLMRYLFPQKRHSSFLEGRINDGTKEKTFCIDCWDLPYKYDMGLLSKVDTYFKMQFPVDLNKNNFALTDQIKIDYIDENYIPINISVFDSLKSKIQPLMVGPRKLADGISYKSLRRGYLMYTSSSKNTKVKKLMCYFGNAKGPEITGDTIPSPYTQAGSLLYFGNKINHPNEKRKVAADILSNCGEKYDARIINESNSDSGKPVSHPELIIPLTEFCDFVSKFEYNLNISGYGMSIPNRFIESFMVGTAIMTDALSVKWYLPFSKEVFETVAMGYLPKDNVNWNGFKSDIDRLPSIDKEEVLSEFNSKWQPIIVSEYIINTVLKD